MASPSTDGSVSGSLGEEGKGQGEAESGSGSGGGVGDRLRGGGRANGLGRGRGKGRGGGREGSRKTKPTAPATRTQRCCSACGQPTAYNYSNPLLGVPLCITCYDIYSTDDYPIIDNNEIYCRWCGQGEGDLLLCDSCPKSFCSRCIQRNFGQAELQRIVNLPDRWSCFVCSPQSLRDLIKKEGWDVDTSSRPVAGKRSKDDGAKAAAPLPETRPGLICYDVSRGRERIEIPVINTVDDAPAPLDFVYVSRPVAGEGVTLNNNPSFVTCCDCTDNCRNPLTCACIRNSGGLNYDVFGRLLEDKPAGIYECNPLCACNAKRCKNRVVGKGPNQRLEVFRCENPLKGWGVRCRDDILPGTFIADYIGEIMLESDAENRGLSVCEEYLYAMDCYGRSVACQKLSDLGLKSSPADIPRFCFQKSAITDEARLRELLGEPLTDILVGRGAVERARQRGAQLRQALETRAAIPSVASCLPADQALACSERPSWRDVHMKERRAAWSQATAVINDRGVQEVDERGDQFTIDARWYGSIGRFLNHSCGPNLDILMVYCDNHDVRMPRVSLFTNDFIPANTELCYDYGYLAGNVEGRHRDCLCGAAMCRKIWY